MVPANTLTTTQEKLLAYVAKTSRASRAIGDFISDDGFEIIKEADVRYLERAGLILATKPFIAGDGRVRVVMETTGATRVYAEALAT